MKLFHLVGCLRYHPHSWSVSLVEHHLQRQHDVPVKLSMFDL